MRSRGARDGGRLVGPSVVGRGARARDASGDKGVKLATLRDYAKAHGLEAYALAATPKDLEHELAAGRPVLLGLMLPYDMQHNQSHYEVAIAIRPSDGSVITIDPATGKWMTRSKKVLDVEWKAAKYAALVVTADHGQAAQAAAAPSM